MTDAHDPHQLLPEHHPTPFTAAEIRAATALGTTITLQHEQPPDPAWTRQVRYVAVGEERATRHTRHRLPDESWSDPEVSESTWLELQEHASFPLSTTARDEARLDLPMGTLDCLRYTVREDGQPTRVFWFARSIPGMPVRVEVLDGDRLVSRVTMVAKSVEPEGA